LCYDIKGARNMGFRFYAYDLFGNLVMTKEAVSKGLFLKEWDDKTTGVYSAEYYGKEIDTAEIEKLYKIFQVRRDRLDDKFQVEHIDMWLDYMQESIINKYSWQCY